MREPNVSVLQAAAQLFQTRGINASTIEDITKAAGIAKGAFYTHFDSKDQLILELVQHFYDDILTKAASQTSSNADAPLTTLQNTIAAELEVATNYQNFLHAVAMDFPPNSTGPVPQTIDTLHRQLHAWHTHILTDAFGTRITPYLEDLVTVLEGSISHYLMRIFWLDVTPPLNRIASFIAESLHAIVLGDDRLTPAFSATWEDGSESQTPLETLTDQLTGLRTIVQQTAGDHPTRDDDLAAIDLILEELAEPSPRDFLIDALLTQLEHRDHLTTHLTPTLTSWNNWKGTPR